MTSTKQNKHKEKIYLRFEAQWAFVVLGKLKCDEQGEQQNMKRSHTLKNTCGKPKMKKTPSKQNTMEQKDETHGNIDGLVT
jgi:hypothetical protein